MNAGTRSDHDWGVADRAQAKRRRERREMHVDRRKSDVDLIDHVTRGARREYVPVTSDDRAPRSRNRRTRTD
jgi:hypothetical protein